MNLHHHHIYDGLLLYKGKLSEIAGQLGIMLTSSKSGLRELHFRGKDRQINDRKFSFSPDVVFSNLLVSDAGQEQEVISDREDR